MNPIGRYDNKTPTYGVAEQRFAPQEHDCRPCLHAAAENFFAPSQAGTDRKSAMDERIRRLSDLVEAMRTEVIPAFECAGATPYQMHDILLWVAHGSDLVADLKISEESQ